MYTLLHTCSRTCVAKRQNTWQYDVHMCALLCAIHQLNEYVCMSVCEPPCLPLIMHVLGPSGTLASINSLNSILVHYIPIDPEAEREREK